MQLAPPSVRLMPPPSSGSFRVPRSGDPDESTPFASSQELDPSLCHALLMTTLARSREGLVVCICDPHPRIVHATRRAARLLGRLGPGPQLPPAIRDIIERQTRDPDGHSERITFERGTGALHVRASPILGQKETRIAVWLREEVLCDDRLFPALREKYALSSRALQLVQLLRRGLTNRQIGEQLNLTESTVKTYLHDLYRECGVKSRTMLLARIAELGSS